MTQRVLESTTKKASRTVIIALVSVSFGCAVVMVSLLLLARPMNTPPANAAGNVAKGLARIPDFTMTERSGRIVTRADLIGQPTVVGFIFTRCHATCPMVTGMMAQVRDQLPRVVRLVTISVDPQYDTPEVLNEYARANHADHPNWWFLSGDVDAVYELIRNGFRLAVGENDDPNLLAGERVIHSTRLAVLDRKGNVRGYFDSTDPAAMSQLKRKVLRLMEEAP